MRRLAAALAAFAALAVGAAPLAAHAADPISKEQRDKGMKEAPAIVQKAGLTCTVSDAYYLGASTTKEGKADIYEVACQQGLGYVLLAQSGGTKAYDCLATAKQPNLGCRLPANADPKQSLKPELASAGVACTPKDARYIGASPTQSVYEVSCQEGPGYILETPAPGVAQTAPVTALPCAQTLGSSAMECTLTPKAQVVAYIQALAEKSGKPCQVSNQRYIGADKNTGDAYYEVACGASAGFVISTDKTGAFKRAINCTQAAGLGGCTMTDTAKIAAEETANYTRLAKAAGFNCDVAKYRAIGQDSDKDDVVELACSNRPDGTVALFPSSPTGRTQFVDCVRAGEFGADAACKLTTPTLVYAKYDQALAAKGRSSCKVSGARYMGRTPKGTDFIETACTDGKPGWVMELGTGDTVKSLLSCGQAASAGLSCQLPTNERR